MFLVSQFYLIIFCLKYIEISPLNNIIVFFFTVLPKKKKTKKISSSKKQTHSLIKSISFLRGNKTH